MNYINWKKIYETGISEIDIQHKVLFKKMNQFFVELFSVSFNPADEVIFDILKELKAYYEYHLVCEKNIYSKDIIQKFYEKENVLPEKINELINEKNKADIVKLYKFAEFLRKWLVEHILLLNDNKFKEVLRKNVIV